MAYWAETSSDIPDNNIAPPPSGAPEGMFPDQLNNVQRQAMAATAEIQQLVLGPGDGSAAPQAAPTGINNDFLKIIYDSMLPTGTMQVFNSAGGTLPFPVPAGSAFSSVSWQICDGTNGTPDLRRVVLGGADPDNASPLYTGDTTVSEATGDAGAVDTSLSVTDDHALTGPQTGPHDHTTTELPHSHLFDQDPGTLDEVLVQNLTQGTGAGANVLVATTSGGNFTVSPAATGLSVDSAGDGDPHSHGLSGLVIPDHAHDAGVPSTTVLEIYQRIA